MPKLTPLHRLSKAYWDEFYTGMTRVGLHPKEKPPFRAGNDVENETMRCMRWAVEALKGLPVTAFERPGMEAFALSAALSAALMKREFDAALLILFPEPLAKRSTKLTGNDVTVKNRAKGKFE